METQTQSDLGKVPIKIIFNNKTAQAPVILYNTMANKIKSIAESGHSPTYFFEVGKRYPFPKGLPVTDIIHLEAEEEHTFHIYNSDGLLAEMINCPVVIVYDQSKE